MRLPRLFHRNNYPGRQGGPSASRMIVFPAIGLVLLAGCNTVSSPDTNADHATAGDGQPAGEIYLTSLLDELDAIAQDPLRAAGEFSHDGSSARTARRTVIASTTTDSTFVYGEITPGGFGAVVTERHQYPKGILLITVRKTHGEPGGGIVSETKKYISFADLAGDSAQQSTVTEVAGLSADTILTHVLRNGILETYTFRLPVVTRVVNPSDGSVRVTSRYGSAGAVVSEVRDGSGSLIQIRRNNGLGDGSVVSYTQFADSSWRNVRSVGEADGTILREITTGP